MSFCPLAAPTFVGNPQGLNQTGAAVSPGQPI